MTRPEALRLILSLGGDYQAGLQARELQELFRSTGRERYRQEAEEIPEAQQIASGVELEDARVKAAQGELFGGER